MNNNFFEDIEKSNTGKTKEPIDIKGKSNSISSILKFLSWCLIVVAVIVLIQGMNNEEEYDIFPTIINCVIYVVYSLIGFALAEIIQILHDIRNKLYSMKK